MRIAVGLSGGVDSSVTAFLMKESGHDVTGVNIWMHGDESALEKGAKDAKIVAEKLGIDFHIIDLRNDFRDNVIVPFCMEYLSGKTPNPCVKCNPHVKLSALLKFADKHGCDKIATGHYSLIKNDSSRYWVSMARDRAKDQSYFLSMVPQQLLSRIIFPLGDKLKSEIFEIARGIGLHTAEKPESQEICFIPDDDYASFIENEMKVKPKHGKIVDSAGKVLGEHKGLFRYTIGQRRGLGIGADRPLYVKDIDHEKNVLVAGYAEDLLLSGLYADNINLMKSVDLDSIECMIKTRSTQKLFKAKLFIENSIARVIFDEKQSGISPGQTVAFYDSSNDILAAATITGSIK